MKYLVTKQFTLNCEYLVEAASLQEAESIVDENFGLHSPLFEEDYMSEFVIDWNISIVSRIIY